jgi:hypothetical protein
MATLFIKPRHETEVIKPRPARDTPMCLKQSAYILRNTVSPYVMKNSYLVSESALLLMSSVSGSNFRCEQLQLNGERQIKN